MINKIQNRTAKAVILLTAALLIWTLNSCAYQTNLTGTWNCDDGGTYYIQQNGDNVWWYGEKLSNSSDNPFLEDYENPVESWSNVARGEISDNLLLVSWSSVPKGYKENMSNGILVLNIISPHKLEAEMKTGGFRGSTWEIPTLMSPGSGFADSINKKGSNAKNNTTLEVDSGVH